MNKNHGVRVLAVFLKPTQNFMKDLTEQVSIDKISLPTPNKIIGLT